MYTAEQLAEPTALQKQTFLLNLYELYAAKVGCLPNGPGEEVSIYAEPSENAMSMGLAYDAMTEQGHAFSVLTEISIDDAGELKKYIEFCLDGPVLSGEMTASDDVAEYAESMELLSYIRRDTDDMTRQVYDPEMKALADGFMSVNAAELAKLISLTESLISVHVRNQSDKPTAF